jgi:N12 class adenine-specific DNA methylase
MAAAVMEQKRLGSDHQGLMVVPGHCLAQISARVHPALPERSHPGRRRDQFRRSKRQRFLARAATGHWDCIIITESAFKFIPVPAAFERAMISDQLEIFEQMLQSSTARIASPASGSSG